MSGHRIDNEEQYNFQFEGASAGASLTVPMQCSALRKSGHVLIDDRPCKIVELSTAKPGKHGHAKVHLIALDIFTGKKLDIISPATHNVDVPVVVRHEFRVLDIEDGYLSLLTEMGIPKDDVKMPVGELGDRLQEDFAKEKILVVTVIMATGEQAVVSFREDSRGNQE